MPRKKLKKGAIIPRPASNTFPYTVPITSSYFITEYPHPKDVPPHEYLIPVHRRGDFGDNSGNADWYKDYATVTRISDRQAFGGGSDSRIRHGYSKNQIYNCNETVIATDGNEMKLLDGQKSQGQPYLSILPFNYPLPNFGHAWSHINPNISYGAYDNIFYQVEHDFVNFTDGTYTQITQFTNYTVMNLGTDETNWDNNDRYFVFQGLKAGTGTDVWLLVWDNKNNGAIHAELNLGHDGSVLDFATMSQSGNYVILSYFTDGSGAQQGMKRLDTDLTNLTHFWDYTAHGDCGYDILGNEVWVSMDYQGIPGYSVNYVNIVTGAGVGIVPNAVNSQGGHVSCRNLKRPGYAYISMGGSEVNAKAGQMARVITSVRLDNSNTMEVWCRTYNDEFTYNHEVHACASPTGQEILFSCNYEDSALKNDPYGTLNLVSIK
jgi:hypothetical protein